MKKMLYAALFAALTAVLSQISIPLYPVPMNLGILGVLLTAGMLGWKYGAISQIVYVLLGMVGAPVFAGFKGGLAVLAGPTGGYIAGYIVMAVITGLIIEKSNGNIFIWIAGMVLGVAVCYALGTAYFMLSTGNTLAQSLLLCVVPFILGDILKIAAAVFLIKRLKKHRLV